MEKCLMTESGVFLVVFFFFRLTKSTTLFPRIIIVADNNQQFCWMKAWRISCFHSIHSVLHCCHSFWLKFLHVSFVSDFCLFFFIYCETPRSKSINISTMFDLPMPCCHLWSLKKVTSLFWKRCRKHRYLFSNVGSKSQRKTQNILGIGNLTLHVTAVKLCKNLFKIVHALFLNLFCYKNEKYLKQTASQHCLPLLFCPNAPCRLRHPSLLLVWWWVAERLL